MCGLAAVACFGHGEPCVDLDITLTRMVRILAHRGPDEHEIRRDDRVGLGFTRLSLVDPSGGGQPLTSADGNIVLIANGEVYNHRKLAATLAPDTRLRTRSDCEVLIHLYRERGLRFLDDVHGMFAIILWDRSRNRLVLARDRFGIKPLYFHRDARRIILASEIKALFTDPRTPRQLDWFAALDNQRLAAATHLGTQPPTAWFAGIEIVPAGCILEVDLAVGEQRQHRYWTFPTPAARLDASDEELVAAYGALLRDSVADCATAEAEVGVFLSGGIDSAAVTALAKSHTSLHTFTVLSGSTVANGDSQHARLMADRLGLPNHQVIFDAQNTPGVAEWKQLLWLFETPMCGPEAYYKRELHRYAKAIRPNVKAMLLGAASDEFNGGYSADYSGETDWPTFLDNLRAMFRTSALRSRPDLTPWFQQLDVPLLRDDALPDIDLSRTDPYHAYLLWEYNKLQQYNVWHEDRAAAGSGIEARVPFLDHRLVELVASIPPQRRAALLWDKAILRRAVRDLLPASIAARPKVPFFYGPGVQHTYRSFIRMLAQDGGALLEDALASPGAQRYVNADAARALLQQLQRNPGVGQIEILLRLVNLGLLENMAAQPPAPLVDTIVATVPTGVLAALDELPDEALATRVAAPRSVSTTAVPSFAGEVLLLDDPEDAGITYLVFNGTIEYVIDQRESANWLRFLRGIDGSADVASLLARAGCERDQIDEPFNELLQHSIVTLDAATPHYDDSEAAMVLDLA